MIPCRTIIAWPAGRLLTIAFNVAIPDLADALIHSREGRTVHRLTFTVRMHTNLMSIYIVMRKAGPSVLIRLHIYTTHTYGRILVLHGENSKRLATPRNTKDKKHLQSTQSAQPTNRTDQAPSTTERTARETHNTK